MGKILSLVGKVEGAYYKAANSKALSRAGNAVSVISSVAMASLVAIPAIAAGGGSDPTAQSAVASLINIMLSIFRYVGIALFIWGVIQFVLATKRSDADSKADAIQTALCGIALMSIGVIVGALNIGGLGNDDVNTHMLDGGAGT